MSDSEERLQVVAVTIGRHPACLWVYEVVGTDNADAVIKMAIARQGVEDRFFTTAPSGKFRAGDAYTDAKE